jgi:hypothetical protein
MRYLKFFMAALIFMQLNPVSATDHDCEQCRGTIGPSIHGSTGKWLDLNVPHRNWRSFAVEDLGEDKQECEMCEREMIRYMHVMHHDNHEPLEVGCICAGHMQGDMEAAKSRDRVLKNRSTRRNKWLDLNWKTSKNGNPYLVTRETKDEDSHHIVITTRNGQYSSSIDRQYVNTWYPTIDAAKLAAFDHLWPSVQRQ